MRCRICDHQLTDKEVSYNEDLKQDEPCTTCLDVALDAAYSGGFSPFGEDVQKVGVDAEWDSVADDIDWSFRVTDEGASQ